jgi:Phage tail sheath C-terminal domain/Phage tail sheath protein subtilisin-like domain
MVEMIIPGTYITVRSEGLISAGRIATGIVGVIGTAASGPVGEPITLSGFAQAREMFGLPDRFSQPEDGSHPLTLVRSLEQIYNNGASSVVAVRVAAPSRTHATYAVQDNAARRIATLTAKTPGSWGNNLQVEISNSEEDCRIVGETQTTGFDQLRYGRIVPSAENQMRVFRGITKLMTPLNILYKRVIQNELVRPVGGRFFLNLQKDNGGTVITPVEPVDAANRVVVRGSNGQVVREYGTGKLIYGAGAAPDADSLRINPATGELIFAATQVPTTETVTATYAIGYSPTLKSGEVLITTWNGDLDFAAGDAPNAANGDRLTANYIVDRANCVQVRLVVGAIAERFTAPDGRWLAQRVNQSSQLVTATADPTHGGLKPATDISAYFGTGSNVPGNNGAGAGEDEYKAGLETLSNQLINIVVLAGQDANTMGSVLLAHLKATEETDYERIGVIGASGATVADFLGHNLAEGRVILVAPGLALSDGTTLPATYTAAAIAGLISSLPVQTSLTNKPVNVPGLALNANRGQQEQLIKRNVLTLVPKLGFRVVKGLTTAGEGDPFSAIPTRRIVDYAKYGVRSAANPYIGRLNNERVRGAMKATLDGFLTRMVEDEALTGYELEVSATRAQEIAGEVNVVMTLQPTFSIDFIRVTMNLK